MYRLREELLARSPSVSPIYLSEVWIAGNRLCHSTASADGRGLVAIGCEEGVWMGLRDDKTCGSTMQPKTAMLIGSQSSALRFTYQGRYSMCHA